MQNTDTLVAHLADVLNDWTGVRSMLSGDEFDSALASRFITRARAAVRRVAGIRSSYHEQAESIVSSKATLRYQAPQLAGVLESLHEDVSRGFLNGASELIHGEVFADFLEMAQHLLEENYKDAAAVIAGSSLEAHLRQLCAKFSVDTEVTNQKGVNPKKADVLNSDLVKAGAYEKLDQKNVTAWLDLRNKAAHGHYAAYEAAQVGVLITGIRDFLTRHPA